MRPFLSASLCSIPLVLVLAAFPCETTAQLISLKTVPVAAGDQFLIVPSQNLGMGGVSIALNDALLDPFVNPAKGARVGEGQFFSGLDRTGPGRQHRLGLQCDQRGSLPLRAL